MQAFELPALTPVDDFPSYSLGALTPDIVVICYKPDLASRLRHKFQMAAMDEWPYGHHPARRLHVTRCKRLGLICCEIGFPITNYLIALLVHFGTKTIYLLTSAGACEESIDLFEVRSAQAVSKPGSIEHCLRHTDKASRHRPKTIVPVHALTVDEFLRERSVHVIVPSSYPCVVEMEAFYALHLCNKLGIEINILGYVSDIFYPQSWRRRRNRSFLLNELGDLAVLIFTELLAE